MTKILSPKLWRGIMLGAIVVFPALAAADDWSGVYSDRFANGMVDGSTYESENRLEILPYNGKAVFFEANLEFYNGHSCFIAGIAGPEKGGYVYRDADNDCVLRIEQQDDVLQFVDSDGNCRAYCGARGSFNGITLPLASRQPADATAIKARDSYKDAVEEFEGGG